MKKPILALITLVLLLAPGIYASEVVNSPPPPPQSVSFDSLVQNLKDVKDEVASFKTDLAETKLQFLSQLDMQYNKLLLLLLFWTLGWTAFCKILGRIWSYVMAKRFERSTQSYQERVLHNLKEIRADLEATDALVRKLSIKVEDIVPPTPSSETKKGSFFARLWPWGKKK